MKRYLLFATQGYSFSILRPLHDAIRARGDEAEWFCRVVSPRSLQPGERLLTSVREVLEYDPAAVFVPTNWVPDFFPGAKVQIFHGFGIDKKGHFRIRGHFDLYCTPGPVTTARFNELARRHPHFAVAETGWPKLDPLFRCGVPTSRGTPLILFAPTFSPSLTSAEALFSEILRLSQNGQWQWIVKFHPNMDRKIIAAYREVAHANLRIADDMSILPLLHQAHVMVSDTSSVVTEALLVDTPVVTFRAQNPGAHAPNFTDPSQLGAMVDRLLNRPADIVIAMRRYAADMHPYRDGRSSERVLAATDDFLAARPKLRKKPLNLFRKLQMRKKFRYWSW